MKKTILSMFLVLTVLFGCFSVCGYATEENETADDFDVTDYIEKIEVIGDDLEYVVYYDECSSFADGNPMLKITYTDGTTQEVSPGDEIKLGNDNSESYIVYLNIYYFKGTYNISVAGYDFPENKYKIRTATEDENYRHFLSEAKHEFGYIEQIEFYALELANQDSVADTLRAIAKFVSFVNNEFLYAIEEIAEDAVLLIKSVT